MCKKLISVYCKKKLDCDLLVIHGKFHSAPHINPKSTPKSKPEKTGRTGYRIAVTR